jgi:DNA-binding response OmpR family regulator
MARILVIDDDERVLGVLRQALTDAGHEVVTACNGNVGVKAFRQCPADLVVTDIIMPEMEGIETIVELRRDHPGVPLVAMSGGSLQGQGSYLPTAEALGATCTLEKPFRLRDLVEVVRSLLERPPHDASRS